MRLLLPDVTSEAYRCFRSPWLAAAIVSLGPGLVLGQDTHLGNHLIISEVAYDTPTESGGASSEYIEIHNPTSSEIVLNAGAVPGSVTGLGSYFISDSPSDSGDSEIGYYHVVNGKVLLSSTSDFVFQFPEGSKIPAHGTIVVCSDGDQFLADFFNGDLDAFRNQPGSPQLFETSQDEIEDNIENMLSASKYSPTGTTTSPISLTNTGEPAILFYWDGESDRVQDADIVVWRNVAQVVNKTGVEVDGPDVDRISSRYEVDQGQLVSLAAAADSSNMYSLQRKSVIEPAERDENGNGFTGHDETSEKWGDLGSEDNGTWAYLVYTPGTPPIRLEGNIEDALSFLPPLAVSAADGSLDTKNPADYSGDGTLTELYMSFIDTDENHVADSLYVAMRGEMFGETNSNVSASFVLLDLDPGAGTGVTSIAGDGNQLSDMNGTLDRRLTMAGFVLDDSVYSNVGFEAAVGIDEAYPTSSDTAGWRLFREDNMSNFAYLGDQNNVMFVSEISALFTGAEGTTFGAPDGFEAIVPLSDLGSSPPAFLFAVGVTTSDSDDAASPNTLPESTNDFFNYPQVMDKGVCFQTSTGRAVVFHVDEDGDGYGSSEATNYCGPLGAGYAVGGGDCDDANDTANPGSVEVCDGADNDCDDFVDESVKDTFYLDEDGDGYGVTDTAVAGCEVPDGYVTASGDCDDVDPEINPGQEELCDDIDNDCSGAIDDNLEEYTVYLDADGDGYGTGEGTTGCEIPTGYTEVPGDCNDNDESIHPDQEELCDGVDGNCDGDVPADEQDADEDGFLACKDDCDDYDPLSYPDAEEICDGGDNNCDEVVPEDEADGDEDGFMICDGDCNDGDVAVNPDAVEICDEEDDNCDGDVDEGVTTTFFLDGDTDNFGGDTTVEACQQSDGYVSNSDDCDDSSAAINPDAIEVCDSIDNDCDDEVDEEVSTSYYPDNDGDGHGSDADVVNACEPVEGYMTEGGDCDDTNASVYPGAVEACDGVDSDCDGILPENERDGDEDDLIVCAGDCDDADPAVYPGADEACDGKDSDCDGTVPDDEVDEDEDGVRVCGEDCDDQNADAYPGAVELCDGDDGEAAIDNDCNPATDELVDGDGDGFSICEGDCNDQDDDISPAATEMCDDVDNDCDATSDENIDLDGDSFTICEGDCDDESDAVSPEGTETCNSLDDNCDGEVDEGFAPDKDGDGAASELCGGGDCNDLDPEIYPGAHDYPDDGVDQDCDGVDPELMDADGDGHMNDVDCNDASIDTYPGADELCDGLDNDCDDVVPEDEVDADEDSFSTCEGDCNDDDDAINPDAEEVCNGGTPDQAVDDDCNPDTDEYATDADEDGFALCGGECNDEDPTINPAALEVCDEIDNDCDPDTDETVDGDGDGLPVCAEGSGPGDCDDTTELVYPYADELCNNIDDNCDGQVDEGFETDVDGDGAIKPECGGGDCDDADSRVYPGAEDIPGDEIDQDCDGEDAPFPDQDGDGYTSDEDCDDADPDVNPDAEDIPGDGIDQDCDGGDAELPDGDGDGYTSDQDCDDADPDINPGATDTPGDGIDQDCDGDDADFPDEDGDGYTSDEDCDDADPDVNPGAEDVPDDGIDQDCDGQDAIGGDDDTPVGDDDTPVGDDDDASPPGDDDSPPPDNGEADGSCQCSMPDGRHPVPAGTLLLGLLALGLMGVRSRRQ